MPAGRRYLDHKLRMSQLRAILALAEHRSFTGAARALALSQPALTKTLQDMERLLGELLFERNRAGLEPTPAGRLLVAFSEQALSQVQRLEDDLNALSRPGRSLVILGALPVSCAGLVPRLVRDLRLRHPEIEIRLVSGRTEQLLPQLALGQVDLVLGRLYIPDQPDQLTRVALYNEPISVIARTGHPLFSLPEGERLTRLRDHDLVLPTFSQPLGIEIEHLLTRLNVSPAAGWLRTASHLFIREILHETDMVAVAPRMLLAGDLSRGSLRILPTEADRMQRPAGVITSPARPLSANATLLVRAVQGVAAELGVAHEAAPITSGYGQAGGFDDRAGSKPARVAEEETTSNQHAGRGKVRRR